MKIPSINKIEPPVQDEIEDDELEEDFSFEDKVPANWVITPVGDSISAFSNKTQETFFGTIKEFSARLRG